MGCLYDFIAKILEKFSSLSSSDWIATIACLISFISLIISLLTEYKNKPKVTLRFSKTFFFDKLEEYKDYIGNSQGILELKIINSSSSPITIHNLSIENAGRKVRWCRPLQETIRINDPYGSTRAIEYKIDKFELPISIEPYGAYRGVVFLTAMNTKDTTPIPLDCTLEFGNKFIQKRCYLKHIGEE